jgi:hypothetical protein
MAHGAACKQSSCDGVGESRIKMQLDKLCSLLLAWTFLADFAIVTQHQVAERKRGSPSFRVILVGKSKQRGFFTLATLVRSLSLPLMDLIITHIFWDVFTDHGSKPSCIEETRHNLCFGVPLYRRLQKLVGNDKLMDAEP